MRIRLALVLFLVSGFLIPGANAQTLNIERVNEFINPQFRDVLGEYAYGDTLHVKGTYTLETATSVSIQLLTFRKDPWTKTDGYGFDLPLPLTGVIDTFLVVPQGYTLNIPSGDTANSQMLQIRANFGEESEFTNLLVTIIESHPVRKTLIDFDEEYGVSGGQTLVNNINTAVSTLQEGDTLLFKSAVYDFAGNSLTLSKGIYLSGVFPEIIKLDSVGAYDVRSSFINLKNFSVRASNVVLMNMRFVPVETVSYVFTRFTHSTPGVFYTNIQVKNTIFENGDLQCYGGSGAEVSFRNVSFLNFKKGGYNCNRKDPIDEMPQTIVKLCKFVPNWDAVYYNTRGISMDAGNDDHPVVWDMNGMLIDSCYFDGNGVGWSKGKNAFVTNCHFIGYRGDVDMIHMEEYTNHIHVEGNIFEYRKPSRTFYQDRSLQPCSDITIINYKFIGKYKWIFWGNSPQNLRFENNDLTEASANNPDDLSFDFTNHQTTSYEAAPYDMPIENLVIRNNPGIDKAEIGIMSIHELLGDTTNIIEDYPAGKIQKNVVAHRPLPLIDTTMIYRIVNRASGEAVSAREGVIEVKLCPDNTMYSSELWEVKFRYPYNYIFRNLETGYYMETYKIYTLGDYDNPNLPIIYIEQKSEWEGKECLPHFFLSEVEGRGSGLFQIYPGTNEKKSRLIKSGENMVLDLAQDKDAKAFFPANESSTWLLEAMEEMSAATGDFLGKYIWEDLDTVFNSQNTIRFHITESQVINDTIFTDSIVLDSVISMYTIYEREFTDSVYRSYTKTDTIITGERIFSDTSIIVIDTISDYTLVSSEERIAEDPLIKIYPQPAKEMLTILVPDFFKNSRVQIMDISGKQILTSQIQSESTRLNISDLSKGTYILHLLSSSSETLFSQQLLIQ